jgi:transposase InsO family protein
MYYQLSLNYIGRDRFIEICKELGYKVKQRINRIKTTISANYRYPNLIEGMLVVKTNQVWQTDITYFRIQEKFYYISFIIDVYSRLIVSYEVSNSLQSKANISALKKAFKKRGKGDVRGLIHHSDRGVQFGSSKYLQLLTQYGCLSSMADKCQDNPYAERINGTIKNEYLAYRDIKSEKYLKRWTKQAVSHYNNERIHNSLPKRLSPMQFEKKLLTWSYQERPKVIIYADGRQVVKGDYTFLNDLPRKTLQALICPIL